jgi:hypothetical protein
MENRLIRSVEFWLLWKVEKIGHKASHQWHDREHNERWQETQSKWQHTFNSNRFNAI